MKKDRNKDLLLEQLKKIPIVQIACEKVGVSRATYYRWRESKKFAKQADKALTEGETLINDMAESQLLTLMKDKHWPSIQFWLKHRNQKFRERVEVTATLRTPKEELTPEEKALVREALRLGSLIPTITNKKIYDPNGQKASPASGGDEQES